MKKTRTEAAKHGDKYYFTGKECKHGHIAKRIVIDGSCHECRLILLKKDRKRIKQLSSDGFINYA